MLDKIQAAVKYLLKDHRDLSARLERIEKVKPVVINGKDGRDAPTIEEVVEAVLAQIPTPKDGESPDPKAIVNDVLAQMPTPRDGKDGRDAPAVNVSDVAAIVLAKLPTPKNGKDGRDAPELSTIVKSVKAQIKTPEPGRPGKEGKNGRDGKNGVSVTKVELERNKLFVWLDGVKKLVGEIKVPAAPSAPFSPGGGMGYASKAEPLNGFIAVSDDAITVSTDQDNPSFLTGFTLKGTGYELFDQATGAVRNVSESHQTADGIISFNPDKIGGGGTDVTYVFSETSLDGGATYQINEGSLRPVEIANNGESFKSAVSFIIESPPGAIVRFRAFTDGAIAFTPSSQTVLGGQTVTGHSMIWNLSKNNG